MVDPQDWFLETDNSNNCGWVRLTIPSSGTSVSVTASGTSCVDDYSDTMYAPYVEWAYGEGITGGCQMDLFCTGNSVTRAQSAMFIARALDLPAATEDLFDDDDGKTHEGDINRAGRGRHHERLWRAPVLSVGDDDPRPDGEPARPSPGPATGDHPRPLCRRRRHHP